MLVKLLDDVALNLSGPYELCVLPHLLPALERGETPLSDSELERLPKHRLMFLQSLASGYDQHDLYKGSEDACRSLLNAILTAVDNRQRIFRVLAWQEEFAGVPK